MSMKHFYKPRVISLIITLIPGVVLPGCSRDDKDANPDETLEGVWKIISYKIQPTVQQAAEGEVLKDTTILYPTDEGVQLYLRLNNGEYEKIIVTPTDTTFENGSYQISGSEIVISLDNTQSKYGFTISGSGITLINKLKAEDGEIGEKIISGVKVAEDPFFDKHYPYNNEDPQLSCSVSHNENVSIGLSDNPMPVLPNVEIRGEKLFSTLNNNGFENRFYLEIKAGTSYSVQITNLESDYALSDYVEISASDALPLGKVLFVAEIEEGVSTLSFKVQPSSGCLYIRFFSYEENVSFSFIVEEALPD